MQTGFLSYVVVWMPKMCCRPESFIFCCCRATQQKTSPVAHSSEHFREQSKIKLCPLYWLRTPQNFTEDLLICLILAHLIVFISRSIFITTPARSI